VAYNNAIPQPTDELRNSQGDILNNFQAIKTAWDINHVTFDLANQGKHNYVTLPEQSAGPATAANELAIYSKQSTLTSVAELFVRKESSGDEIEFTSAIAATPGWTRLPSGILLKWGATTANGATTITLPTGATIPAFTTIFSVQLTIVDAGATDADEAVSVRSFATPTAFNVFASARSTTGAKAVNFEYLVIGE